MGSEIGTSVWLDGDVLMCACPDCQAPLSIRLWLMTADCWCCETSIELSDAQQEEVRQLLARQAPPLRQPRPGKTPPPPAEQPPLPSPAPRATTTGNSSRRPAARRRTFDAPPWLISLLLHLVALFLLALLTIPYDETIDYITLSTAVHRDERRGGELLTQDPLREIAFDLPISPDVDMNDSRQRATLIRANEEASQIRLDPDVQSPHLPDVDIVRSQVKQQDGVRASFVARDPRIRVEIVRREGGTTLTEAAVSRGLFWLSRHQEEDGRWSLHRFHQASRCSCSARGSYRSDSAATSLALLPYLGAGQTHLVGMYRNQVSQGLRALMSMQGENGDLRGDSEDNSGMYAHGQGTIVLCEAYSMTGDEQLRGPAQKAVDFIVAAQHYDGGWRYRPQTPGDTSVLGWQLMALQSARAAQLKVPAATLELAGHYLDQVSSHHGSRYAYQPGRRPDHVMTAEALLCREYLGWKRSDPGLRDGLHYLLQTHPPDQKHSNMYYWYYATQAMHHVGGSQWRDWNQRMREVLVSSQQQRGHEAGSWSPVDRYDRAGGRLYVTALATCTLEVYYRHLPLFRADE